MNMAVPTFFFFDMISLHTSGRHNSHVTLCPRIHRVFLSCRHLNLETNQDSYVSLEELKTSDLRRLNFVAVYVEQ